MPLKIVRNDITKMQTEAIVNTANDHPTVGTGCDHAIYQAAGYDDLLKYRTENVGYVPEGDAFITPAFQLPCRYIIHAVSPLFIDGDSGEEGKLRSCYRKSLELARKNNIKTIAFPLIATGGFGYPKEEGFRIAVDEINSFLIKHDMMVYIVVFDNHATTIGSRLSSSLEAYIDQNYVEEKREEEYLGRTEFSKTGSTSYMDFEITLREKAKQIARSRISRKKDKTDSWEDSTGALSVDSEHSLEERMKHVTDSFSEYLLYLIDSKGMSYPEVYRKALVDKKVFSRLKNHPESRPKKITALCLCVGAELNMDQSKDLLARAGYAFSPCDKTDIIFSYFIENGIYDMIELDITLEEHGLNCIIS
ncbi:MAG: macro domain-containing protein [Eubacteriales bacterium]|nr:macro domain-containing protein [Eubacteriales bacterium]